MPDGRDPCQYIVLQSREPLARFSTHAQYDLSGKVSLAGFSQSPWLVRDLDSDGGPHPGIKDYNGPFVARPQR